MDTLGNDEAEERLARIHQYHEDFRKLHRLDPETDWYNWCFRVCLALWLAAVTGMLLWFGAGL